MFAAEIMLNVSYHRLDGACNQALFELPQGVAVDYRGNLVVSEYGPRIRLINLASSSVITIGGSTAGSFGSTDGQGVLSLFGDPWQIALDTRTHASVWVIDQGSGIRTVSLNSPYQSGNLSPASVSRDGLIYIP